MKILLNLLISIAVAAVIGIIGYFYIWYYSPANSLTDYIVSAVLYLAVVVGGGCCWIGLNQHNQ